MFEHVDWDTTNISTIISTITSGVLAFGIALYFRYRVKPKFEIIYDSNRQANINLIFNGLNYLDSEFESFYTIIENELGELTKEREEIIPSLKVKPKDEWIENDPDISDFGIIIKMTEKYDGIRKNLAPMLTIMREHHKKFLQDYHINLNYLHDSFLRDVNSYYITTTYYAELLLQCQNYYSIGIKRKSEADKIIEYVNADGSVDKTPDGIREFIYKWKDWKPKESES